MHARTWHLIVVACLTVLAQPLVAQEIKLPVPLPEGTEVMPIKIGDSETPIVLKPAEQVALVFVYSIWNLEQASVDKDMGGPGRLSTLGELIKGVKGTGGGIIGLKVSPAKDTNYNYDVLIIGEHAIIRAIPRVKGIGAFGFIGTGKGFNTAMYFNPNGNDLTKAAKITEVGYSGNGFSK